MRCVLIIPFSLLFALPDLAAQRTASSDLPRRYYQLLETGVDQAAERLAARPPEDLKTLEAGGHSRHLFPHMILAAAVLYASHDPANHRYHQEKMLALARQIGDLLAAEYAGGSYQRRLNSDRDTYMWLDAFRILEPDLGEQRRAVWRQALEQDIAVLAADSAERAGFPGYQSPFIGTSPNHLSLWASTVYLAGKIFARRQWVELGAQIMHRFAAQEQSPDGFWGEHERSLPTPGYDYTTYTGVALYYEFSHDPSALEALRRGLTFHEYFTYPDGVPVETIDDRNRYTIIPGWSPVASFGPSDEDQPPGGNDESGSKGQFGFSNFPDGRRYAEFLTGFFRPGEVGYEDLGRLAQDALYYHRGPKQPIPPDLPRYSRRLSVPAGIRKTGPWIVCLSGLISTQAINSQFYLDRQANLSIFHEKTGLIVTGAGSKHQPELATFSESLLGQIVHMPMSSRLDMDQSEDRLALAYNTFFSELSIGKPSGNTLPFRFLITGKGRPAGESKLTLQICLKPGELLYTGGGKKLPVGKEKIDLSPADIGGWIGHHGWKLEVDPEAHLSWPAYPHDPYTNAPEKSPQHAVGALVVPLRLKAQPGRYVRPREQTISFVLHVE